jgi:signal transduction histidine kinase/CheY-like chemotaxis protein/HPt (histidine-containing phosphotransfer) domain-containing protein
VSANPIFEAYFANQGFALFESLGDGELRVIGSWPEWSQSLWGEVSSSGGVRLGEVSPFLENFLFDAEEFWKSKAAGSVGSGNWTERDATGREIPLEASAYFLGGKRILIVRNLSDTFGQTQEIFQTARDSFLVYEKLVREVQKKEILLHCIVHDLTQPLSAMSSVFHLLEREHLSPELKKYVKTGERESQRQELMIRGILEAFSSDLAAQSSAKGNTEAPPDLAVCARRAVEEFSPSFRDHEIRLRVDPRLKKSADWRVVGDASRIDRIFGNLLENAMRYSPKDTTVTIGLEDEAAFVLAFVDDEGPGLPKDQPEAQLFALFSKGKSNSGKAGLGLYFCKITVERWGGQIGAETRPQGGSRFWFRLPRGAKTEARKDSAEPKLVAQAEKQHEKLKPAKRLRILVADDADINRELLVELLEKRGHIAIGVSDGRAAVTELEKHDFDILLIDEEMPRMTGVQATAAIREREAGTQRHQIIIGISGHATEEDEKHFRDAGMDALLPKPVHMQKLYEVVESTAAGPAGRPSPTPASTIAPAAVTGGSTSRPATGEPGALAVEAMLDPIAHLNRSTGGNEKLMRSLVESLLSDAPKTIAAVGRAVAKNDAAGLSRAAHLLKGSLAIFGPSKAVESARALEAMGRSAHLREAPLEFGALQTEFNSLRLQLAPLASKKSSPAQRPKARPVAKRAAKSKKRK